MKIILKVSIGVAILVVICVVILIHAFYGNAVRRDVVIELSHRMLDSVEYECVVKREVKPYISSHAAFDFYASHLNLPTQGVRAGRYELRRGMSVIEIVRMLKLGTQSSVNITFNNARHLEQLAGRLATQIEADSIDIIKAMRSRDLANELGYKSEELMAIFIPNTYNVWWTITPEDLVRRMAKEYDRFWTPEREAQRKRLKMSRVEISALASIVYEETLKVDEMPRVAGVYINRLRRGIRLQADPTVKFAMGDFTIKRVLYRHLTYDSPYNTYMHKGLPPGPIALGSIAALNSVLAFEEHKYIYFCARPEMDGYHNFATTLTQHKLNAKLYSEELNRRGVR